MTFPFIRISPAIICVSGAILFSSSPEPAAAQDWQTGAEVTPWVGEKGIVETTGQIMERQRLADLSPKSSRPVLKRRLLPKRGVTSGGGPVLGVSKAAPKDLYFAQTTN